MIPNILLLAGLAVLFSLLAVIAYRTWRRGRAAPAVAARAVAASVPDLAGDDVGAEDLPVTGWMALAHDLLHQGDLRLALRALFLAQLARLAEFGLITLARYKSNREYERELARRRTGRTPELLADFADNLSMFDRVWYGRYDVDRGDIDRFMDNQGRMISGVERAFSDSPPPPTPPG